ncbi:uncharacterized protein N0V89_006964 [Didymosphaeria variabile]|uniref:Transcription factor domain-containing protein n=1 Tax=Didymosphaeria variabile TaxID=1932322 RepID=A0A9W8XJY6_9PLEO|nr:uncharacterized protein N0V89_006964 [Didymosphaeria variabile]KAJ4351621.1 hypothetical protein N0V89_006964 [Didymosphaeria variabile]
MVSPISSWNVHGQSVVSSGSITSDEVDVDGHDGSELAFDDETQTSSNEGIDQPPLMLSSVNGENVFIGNTAAISFLRFLQKTLERHVGPSGFTVADDSHKLFEADSADVDPNSVYDSLSIDEKSAFIQVFLDAVSASYEVSAILNEAVAKSAEFGLDMEATEAFVLALRQSSRTFPPILRHHGSDKNINTRHMTIGNVHVAGSYYFSVILVTRHCLIRHVVPLLSEQARNSPRQAQSSEPVVTENTKVAHLADACIDAASLMAQMCHQVMKSGMLIGNMCILKAWIFATGLVLGFSILVEDGHSFSQKRAAFLKSLHVLGELKRMSPQAEQYYNILMSFHQSIKSYREQLIREKQESRPTLVDRVFFTDSTAEVDEAEHITTQFPSPDTSVLEPSLTEWPLELDHTSSAANAIGPIDPALMGDNDVIMRMLWDVDKYAGAYLYPMLPDVDMGLDCSAQVGGSIA